MRIIPFKIPKSPDEAFKVQVDDMPHLYNHLHHHPEIQVTLIQKSEGTLIAGDYIGRFVPGDVFVLGSHQPHVFRNDEKYLTRKYRALTISVFFDEYTLGKEFWQLPEMKTLRFFTRNSSGGFKVTGTKQEIITALLRQLLQCEGLSRIICFMQLLQCFANRKELMPLARQARHTLSGGIKNYDSHRMNKVLEFTFRESHRSIRISEVAQLANLSTEAFCKYFKTRTMMTYIAFLNEIRINNACKMLMERDSSVEEIAYEAGFSNLSNFNRQFRKITGTSPLQFRKKVLAE